MSLFGIDIGSKNIVVAALNRNSVHESIGCDVLANENSNRLTPAIMSFKGTKRLIGDNAYQMINNNFKNTISSVKHFLGDKLTDKEIRDYSDYCLSPNIRNGMAYYNLEFSGRQIELEAIQVLSQYFLKSKQIISENISPINDYKVSVAVPPYYDFQQIQCAFSSAKIVGLNVIDLVFENTAISTCYYIDNIKRMKLLTRPEYVMFVDIGHSAATVTITEYTSNNINIISTKSDLSLGGILIDRFMVDHLSQIFAEKYSINPINNSKSKIKLFRASERCKQSLNPENVNKVPVNIDCLFEDYDLSTIIERTIIENAINTNNFHGRLKNIVLDCLNLGNLTIDRLKSVEIIGGTMRIPYLKNILKDILGNKLELSTTLNMDECISKGCVYYSLFRRFSREPILIRDYNNIDISSLKHVRNFDVLQKFQVELDKQDQDNKLRSELINQIEQLIINTHKRVEEVKPERRDQFLTLLGYCEEWLRSDECERTTTQNLSEKYNSLYSDIQTYFQSGYLGGALFTNNSPSAPPFDSKSGTGPIQYVQNNNNNNNFNQRPIADPNNQGPHSQMKSLIDSKFKDGFVNDFRDKNPCDNSGSTTHINNDNFHASSRNMPYNSTNTNTNANNNSYRNINNVVDRTDNILGNNIPNNQTSGNIPAPTSNTDNITLQSNRNSDPPILQATSQNPSYLTLHRSTHQKSDIPIRHNVFNLQSQLDSYFSPQNIDFLGRCHTPSSTPRQMASNRQSNQGSSTNNINSRLHNTSIQKNQFRGAKYSNSNNLPERDIFPTHDLFHANRGRSDLPLQSDSNQQRKSRIHSENTNDNMHVKKKVNIGRSNNESSYITPHSPILSPENKSFV